MYLVHEEMLTYRTNGQTFADFCFKWANQPSVFQFSPIRICNTKGHERRSMWIFNAPEYPESKKWNAVGFSACQDWRLWDNAEKHLKRRNMSGQRWGEEEKRRKRAKVLLLLSFYRNIKALKDSLLTIKEILQITHFYRTHVHMGSDHWIALSLSPSVRPSVYLWLKPCEDPVQWRLSMLSMLWRPS